MDPTPQKPRRSHGKAILLLLFVFLLGNLTGIGGASALMLKRLQSNFRNPATANGPATKFLDRTEKNLADNLDLTPDERERVHREFQVTRERLAAVRARMVGELRWEARDSIRRIAREIPEEKRQQFRERAIRRLRPWGFAQENETPAE